MQKALSLILALIMCLSLCACGLLNPENKYAGSYTSNYSRKFVIENGTEFGVKELLVINSDGTGTLSYISENTVSGTNNYVSPAHHFTIEEGDVLAELELEWSIVNEKLMFNATGKRYYTSEADYITDSNNSQTVCDFGGDEIETHATGIYTLKDDQLYSGSRDCYTKVD